MLTNRRVIIYLNLVSQAGVYHVSIETPSVRREEDISLPAGQDIVTLASNVSMNDIVICWHSQEYLDDPLGEGAIAIDDPKLK